MVRSIARRALPVVAGVFVAGCLLQVFLAGLGVFENPERFLTHSGFGYVLGWFTLVMLVLALLAREPRRIVGLTILVLVQFALQSIFVAVRVDYPMVAALHPVNGFLILAVGALIARLSWATRADPAPARAATAEAAASATSEAA
jgi:hypothetical protein